MKTAQVIGLAGACSLSLALASANAANLLTNGSFESSPAGTNVTGSDFHDVSTIAGWRAFAVSGAAATMTVTSAAASDGGVGLMLARNNALGDSAVDKDFSALRENIPGQARVYKFLVDAKDGGTHGGTPSMSLGSQFAGGLPAVNNRTIICDPGAQFETVGLSAVSTTGGTLSTRIDLGPVAGRSVYLDNVRAVDVTRADRMINGGFENSASRTLNWRFFSVSSAAGSVSLSTDAATGNTAALLERTNTIGDLGLDTWDSDKRIAVIGGEEIVVNLKAKLVSGINAGLGWNVATFKADGTYIGDVYGTQVKPGSDSYYTFSSNNLTLPANVAFISVGFRIWGPGGAPGIGAFLIDDVAVVPEPGALIMLAVGLLLMRRPRLA